VFPPKPWMHLYPHTCCPYCYCSNYYLIFSVVNFVLKLPFLVILYAYQTCANLNQFAVFSLFFRTAGEYCSTVKVIELQQWLSHSNLCIMHDKQRNQVPHSFLPCLLPPLQWLPNLTCTTYRVSIHWNHRSTYNTETVKPTWTQTSDYFNQKQKY
jgi:hypothetical protein